MDNNCIKSIRKAHCQGNEFQREDNVERAANILLETKNRHTKEQIDEFSLSFFKKYPERKKKEGNVLKKNQEVCQYSSSQKRKEPYLI